MKKDLVIVESPAKAKTIEKFLGKRKYTVKASVGHIRDLPKSKLGVDVENDFEPQYITIRGKGVISSELRKEAKKSERIYLATDQDREGEAISWHLSQMLKLDPEEKNRIVFNEITKDAIKKSIKEPRKIDTDLVDAQQARRIIDRLVGYKISPILWAKVRRGLSAGRVQSVTTKLICDREKEIQSFVPEEYWTYELLVAGETGIKSTFKLISEGSKKIQLSTAEDAQQVTDHIKDREIHILKREEREKRKQPYRPYTTSTLQQDAVNRLRFSTKKTMMLAQQLYDGIDVKGEGTIGLITYMRTDSQRISMEAQHETKQWVEETLGSQYYKAYYLPQKKSSGVQDAHECIRPSSVYRTPDQMKDSLSPDQFKLYQLIWQRFVAAQMSAARYQVKVVTGGIEPYVFKANGSRLVFEGFLKIYPIVSQDTILDEFLVEKNYEVNESKGLQHFTKPPSRYTEASLVKELEELGIGRPSTYAPTISTILSRGYVEKQKNTFLPTELGNIVTSIMEENFEQFVDVEFTAKMESELDEVEDGKHPWRSVVAQVYQPLEKATKEAEEKLEKIILEEESDEICDVCGSEMTVKYGRFGKFHACKNYPECSGTKPFLKKIGVKCPLCKEGEVVVRHSKRGRMFYGCSRFPDCRFLSNARPTGEPCPSCKDGYLVEKNTKKEKKIICSNKECKYERIVEE